MENKVTFAQQFCLTLCKWLLVILCLCIVLVIVRPEVLKDSAVSGFLGVIISALIAMLASLYKYITASSAGSQSKDDVITNSTLNTKN